MDSGIPYTIKHFEVRRFAPLGQFDIWLYAEVFVVQSLDSLASFNTLNSASQLLEFCYQVPDKGVLSSDSSVLETGWVDGGMVFI